MLGPVIPNMYAGLTREQASREAQKICGIAAQTGQTVLAHEHLTILVRLIADEGTLRPLSVYQTVCTIDPEVLKEYLTPDPGEKIVMNVLRKNGF